MSLLNEDKTEGLTQTELNWRLFDAIYYKDVDSIYRYIFAGAQVKYANEVGNQCIHAAAHTGKPKIVQIILNAGGDVHAKGRDDNTPLHYAVVVNSLPVVRLLLERGADPRAVNRKGKSARDICSIDNTRKEVLEELESWVLKRCSFLFTPSDKGRQKGSSQRQSNASQLAGRKLEFTNVNFSTLSQIKGSKQNGSVAASVAKPLIEAVQPLITDAKKLGKKTLSADRSKPQRTLFNRQSPTKRAIPAKTKFVPETDKNTETIISVPFEKLKVHNSVEAKRSSNVANGEPAIKDRVEESPKNGFYIEIDGKEVFVPEDLSDEEMPAEESSPQAFEPKTSMPRQKESESDQPRPENIYEALKPNVDIIIPVENSKTSLGIQLQEANEYTKVCDLNPIGVAATAGVAIGDILMFVNEINMRGELLAQVMASLASAKEVNEVRLKLYRQSERE